jgi:hypothetical protein
MAPAIHVAGPMGFETCLVKWRTGQDKNANTDVIEVAV